LKKGILWKVTKDTIDIENEEFFSYARSRSKSSTLCPCIEKRNNMHLPKKRKVRAKRNSRMSRGLHPFRRKCQPNKEYTQMKLISRTWKETFVREFDKNMN
jgi:hypothetical protein